MDRKRILAGFLLMVTVATSVMALLTPRAATPAGPSAQSASVWTESTASDFRGGTLERVQVRQAGDGDLILGQIAGGGYDSAGVYVSRPFRAPNPFSAAIWKWDANIPDGTTLILSARTSLDGETWTAWQETEPDDDLRSLQEDWPGHLLVVQEASYLQYRLRFATSDPTVTPALLSITWTFADTRPGPSVEQAMQMVVPKSDGPGIPRPAIIPRRGWGANESLMTWEPEYETPRKIIIHHTATPNTNQDPAAMVRAVYYYHAVTRGWGDIGYNYLIDRMGNIYEGRFGGERVIGGHDHGFNTGSVGISLIGDFQDAEPPAAMLDALVRLMAWLCDHYGIAPLGRSDFGTVNGLPNISAHRDTKSTTCPGDRMYAHMSSLRTQVRDTIGTPAPTVRILSPEAGAVLSGRTEIEIQGGLAADDLALYIDNGLMQREAATPLRFAWDTTAIADGDHQIKAVARSHDGREASQALMVLVDNTPPAVALLINGGQEYATQEAITLTVDAFDVGSGVESMRLIREGDPSLAPLQPYRHEVPFTLADEPGPQTFSAQVYDRAGLVSPVALAVVFYDPNPPYGWTEILREDSGVVSVQVHDDESGLDPSSAFFTVSEDGGLTWSVESPATFEGGSDGAATLRAEASDEANAIRFAVADKAGSRVQSPIYVIPYEGGEPPPPPPAPQPPALPDLIVTGVEIFPPEANAGEPVLFRTTIRNAGTAPATGFWVQLYLDPRVEPAVNTISSQIGTGIFWFVDGLAAGGQITLSSSNPYAEYTNYPGHLASGLHTVYVLADGYHTEGTAGLVYEPDEENNLYGPVSVQAAGSSPFSWKGLEEWLSRWFRW